MSDQTTRIGRPMPQTPSPQGPERRTSGVILGAALLVVGLGWLLDAAGIFSLSWDALIAIALVVIGIGLILGSRWNRNGGLIALSIVLIFILAMNASARVLFRSVPGDFPRAFGPSAFEGGFGDFRVSPATADELEKEYVVTAGELILDLGDLEFPQGETKVRARVTFGEIRVLAPTGIAIEIRSQVGAGDIRVFGQRRGSGTGVIDVYRSAGYQQAERRLSLELFATFGQVEVYGAGP